jgi:hypothetical protein
LAPKAQLVKLASPPLLLRTLLSLLHLHRLLDVLRHFAQVEIRGFRRLFQVVERQVAIIPMVIVQFAASA